MVVVRGDEETVRERETARAREKERMREKKNDEWEQAWRGKRGGGTRGILG